MKKLIILLIGCSIIGVELSAQNCKVLLNTINESYEGDCKKGKADGKGIAKGKDTYEGEFKKGWPNGHGIYTWSNGNVYEGKWVKGKKEGAGKLIIKRSTKRDSILSGYWKKDEYIGQYKSAYQKIDKSSDVSSLSINEVKNKSGIYSIRFYLKVDQQLIYNPQMTFAIHTGQYRDMKNNNDYVELSNVTFPIKLKAYYGRDYIEIEIFKPGLWDVRTEITKIKGLNSGI